MNIVHAYAKKVIYVVLVAYTMKSRTTSSKLKNGRILVLILINWIMIYGYF